MSTFNTVFLYAPGYIPLRFHNPVSHKVAVLGTMKFDAAD